MQYVEPNPVIEKSANPRQNVEAGQDVTYTLTAKNPATTGATKGVRTTSFDSVVYDCVPVELAVKANPLVPSQGTAKVLADKCAVDTNGKIVHGSGSGTLIEWKVGEIVGGTSYTLAYVATTPANAGGAGTYVNRAEITGYTLPTGGILDDTTDRRGDRVGSDSEAITMRDAGLTKTVDKAQAPVGDVVKYTITTNLPANLNFYNVSLEDTLPAGVTFVDDGTASVEITPTGVTGIPTFAAKPTISGNTLTWISASEKKDIDLSADEREIIITFSAKIKTGAVTPVINNAKFAWNTTKTGTDRLEKSDDATTTIVDPLLSLNKRVMHAAPSTDVLGKDKTGDVNQKFTYSLDVTNATGANIGAAYNTTVTDKVPAGVVVDESSFKLEIDGTPVTNPVVSKVGDLITWTIAGAIVPGGKATLTYDATFGNSENLFATPDANGDEDPRAKLVNIANVTEYHSFPTDGREYKPGQNGLDPVTSSATVTPLFPHVVPVKTVGVSAGVDPDTGEDYGIAYVDKAFGWKLAITNHGEGIASAVDVVDTLPENWEYDAGSAKLKVGATEFALANPGETKSGDITTLRWTAADLTKALDTLFPLGAGATFEIVFNAKPTAKAVESPGSGLEVGVNPHTNTVLVDEVKDAQGNKKNATVPTYAGDKDTADAYIAEADLKLVKEAIGGVVEQTDPADNLYKLDAGAWVPGQGVVSGKYDLPQWQITVTNHGPDASFGAFKLTEDQTLPKGVTVSNWVATYYPADGSTPTGVTVTGEKAEADLTLIVGDATTSLNPLGTDRIVITADVEIDPGTKATAKELANTATVEGETFERESNMPKDGKNPNPNTDDAGKALDPIADLAIVKSFSEETKNANLNAGDIVNWALDVTNHGPDHSLSSKGAGKQIVVIDDVPSEIVDPVSVAPAGWEFLQDGNKFTFTMTPDAVFKSGVTVRFDFSGRIGGDVAADTVITNTATVTPGETPDADLTNNEDEDTVTPKTAHTSVAATKQRVVFENGAWVPGTGSVAAGDTVNYRLTFTNTGDYVAASGVTIVDDMPSYLTMTDWQAEAPTTGWAAVQNSDTKVTFTNPTAKIAPGKTASIILTTKLAADHRVDLPVENTECVTTGNLDPAQATADDCSTTSTEYNKSVDWELLKSHVIPAEGDPVNAGETVRYRLVLNNNGPSVSDDPITISDVLPAGFSYAGNVVATGATLSAGAVEGQKVTWTADGPFAVGASVVTVEFDALVAADTTPGTYENTARVDGPADEPDANPANNDDTDEVPVIRHAQMNIEKEVLSVEDAWGETAEHAAGTSVTWRVKITNDGPSAAPVTFTDDLTLAPGVTLTGIDGGSDWTCDVASQECAYVANGGLHPVTLADGSNASWITITTTLAAHVPPTAAPGLVNWGEIVWVDSTNGDGNTDRDDANITTVRNADLGLVKQVRETAPDGEWIDANSSTAAGSVTAGKSTSYRVLVTNEGTSDAVAPLTVVDTLPAGATFEGLSASPEWSASYDEDTNTVTFTRGAEFGGLVVGGTPLVVEYGVAFDSALAAGSMLENNASFAEETTTTNGDQNPDNNSDPANVVIDRQIDLGIVKSHDADRVRIGDVLPFTVDVTNHGPSEATGIVVTDTVPAGLDVVSALGDVLDADGASTGWTIESVTPSEDGTTAVVAVYAHPLAPGATAAPLVIDTLVTPAAYETVTNVVVVKGNEPEPDPDTENPNHSEDPVTVPPMVTLVVEKSAVGVFKVGEIGTYKIVVSNDGPTLDPGPITVTDDLPAGLSYNSAPELPVGATVDHSRGLVTWTLTEPLGVGESVELTLKVNVHQSAYDQPNHEITNTVVIDSESELTPDSVLTDDATVKVTPADPLVVTGGDIAAGLLAAMALLLLLGGATYSLGRRRQGAAHGA